MIKAFKNIFTKNDNRPDFLIIGAQKAGTSALHKILDSHSLIKGAECKEIHYFDREPFSVNDNYKEYHRYFEPLKKGCIYFESTPSYIYHEDAPNRIYHYNSKLKLIISLREPASRALSAWTMYHHHFKNKVQFADLYDELDFKSAIERDFIDFDKKSWIENKRAYINRGIYYKQIERYFNLFPKENILIIESNELNHNHKETLRSILEFLKAPYENIEQKRGNESKVNNKNDYQDTMTMLRSFYKPYNEKLFQLIGKRYDW